MPKVRPKMHPFAKRHFEKVLRTGELLGIDKGCKYYSSCHHAFLEDCTFCYCPFYPCGDKFTGGKWIKGAIMLDALGFYDELLEKDPEKILDFSDWMGIPMEPYNISLDRLKSLLSEQIQ